MNKLIETAKEIDRILKSGIEIHPNSPIHEKLQQALKIPPVSSLACKHEWIMTADSFDQTCYCKKCGKSS